MLLALFTALTGLAYPLAITAVAQLAAPAAANGSLIARGGVVVGSQLIGQSFAGAGYFHGRPSATQAPDPKDASKTVDAPYNAANSAGSNLGPTSAKLIDRIKASVAAWPGKRPVPADAATTSASGLDPEISPAYRARPGRRCRRRARAAADKLRALVQAQTRQPTFGVIGEPQGQRAGAQSRARRRAAGERAKK